MKIRRGDPWTGAVRWSRAISRRYTLGTAQWYYTLSVHPVLGTPRCTSVWCRVCCHRSVSGVGSWAQFF